MLPWLAIAVRLRTLNVHPSADSAALRSRSCTLRRVDHSPLRSQLRLNKVSELIHNSTQHRNLEQARVSVFFEEIIDHVRPLAG